MRYITNITTENIMKEGDLVRHKHSKWLAVVHAIGHRDGAVWVQTFDGHVMFSRSFALEVISEDR